MYVRKKVLPFACKYTWQFSHCHFNIDNVSGHRFFFFCCCCKNTYYLLYVLLKYKNESLRCVSSTYFYWHWIDHTTVHILYKYAYLSVVGNNVKHVITESIPVQLRKNVRRHVTRHSGQKVKICCFLISFKAA